MAQRPELDLYGQSFSPVPHRLVSDDRYGPTSSGPLLPKGISRPRRSSPCLQNFDYVGPYAYSLTLNAEGRRPHFRDEAFVRFCMSKLQERAEAAGFDVLAFCFMPTHVHLLVKGLTETSGLRRFVQRFKQDTGFAFKTERQRELWQRSFHDRVIRRDEDLHAAAAYIWANPVRAGLAGRMEDYRYSGPSDRLSSGTERRGLVRDDRADRNVDGQSLSSVPTGGAAATDLDAR